MARKKKKQNTPMESGQAPASLSLETVSIPSSTQQGEGEASLRAEKACCAVPELTLPPHAPQRAHGVPYVVAWLLSILLTFMLGLYAGTLVPDLLVRLGFPVSLPTALMEKLPASFTGAGIPAMAPHTSQERIRELEARVQAHPEDAPAWAQLGNLYFDKSRVRDAIAAFERSLALAPDQPEVLLDLGIMYREAGKYGVAAETFHKVSRIVPQHQHALFNRGVVLFFDLGRKDEARDVWRQLLAINPKARTPDGRAVRELLQTLR